MAMKKFLVSMDEETVKKLDEIGGGTRTGVVRYIVEQALKQKPGKCSPFWHCEKCGAPVAIKYWAPDRVDWKFECLECGHVGEPAREQDEADHLRTEIARLRAALAALLVAHQIAGNGKTKEEAEAAANQQIERIISGEN